MANKSDHSVNRTRIDQYLPDVNRSEVNEVLFEGSFNRHLTKDDTIQVVGYVGEPNPNATQTRRILETDPHIDAFQLEPVMVSSSGTDKRVLTQASFLTKLGMLGVDEDRLKIWGSTTKFNWVPPINMDMLVHYYNYYWRSDVNDDTPQYFTIENRCNKAKTKTEVYKVVLRQHGNSIALSAVDPIENVFVVDGQIDEVFTERFVFNIVTSARNFTNRVWTVQTTVVEDGQTKIYPVESIAIKSSTQPTTTKIGQWWVNTTDNTLREWNGVAWVAATTTVEAHASLDLQLERYTQAETCACSQQSGWDTTLWDDNQLGNVIWNDSLLDQISFMSESDWVDANGTPTVGSMWYNLTNDTLQLYTSDNDWKITTELFSQILEKTTGTEAWDYTKGCIAQQPTPWADQNKWIHKTQVDALVGIKRAQVPILEYDSNLELNKWVRYNYAWKYRADVSEDFADAPNKPSRLELEPIKGFEIAPVANGWKVYLYSKNQQAPRNIDYTDVFVPGYTFRITDETGTSVVCITDTSEFRTTNTSDPVAVRDGSFVTVVTLTQAVYTGPTSGGGSNYVRIEPILTSKGDAWRGYHIHWMLDTEQTTTTATSSQEAYTVDQTVETLAVSQGTMYVGFGYQELTTNAEYDTFELEDSLKYNPTTPSNLYAGGELELRVYINGVRQYGTYTVQSEQVEVDYIVVGHNAYTADADASPFITAVTGITFNSPVAALSVVRIEVGPSSRYDVGTTMVPVRTVADEDEFARMLASRTQPEMLSLPTYGVIEQVKSSVNQYPLFNIYNIVTGEVIDARPIFSYVESDDSPINVNTQRRIVSLDAGRDFAFEQSLLDVDLTRAYKLTGKDAFIWYSPLNNEAKLWDGAAYRDKIEVTSASSLHYLHAITCSETDPGDLVDASLWLNTQTLMMYKRNQSTTSWDEYTAYTVEASDVDPMLYTVWRKGTNDEQYVPSYVNRAKESVAVGTPDASWERLDQWYYNLEHENQSNITFSQLVAHFNSILNEQPHVPALLGGGVYSYSQSEINRGLGGTIREHNYSFDTLISAINNPTVTPLGVIEFARDQYENALLTINQLTQTYIPDVFASSAPSTTSDVYDQLISDVISRYEQNDFTFRLFGDGVSYTEDGKGIRNWVATLPLLGLSDPTLPNVSHDKNGSYVVHHDGHRSTITLSASEFDNMAQSMINRTDSSGFQMGVRSSSAPVTSFSTLQTVFLGDFYVGKLWYRVNGTSRKLYQLQALTISDVAPSTVGVLNGVKYYNTTTNQSYVLTSGAWVATSDAPGTLGSLWVEINLASVIADVIHAVEMKLYDASVDVRRKQSSFEYSVGDQEIRETYVYRRFLSYLRDTDITAPFANTAYNAGDAFTWNYMFSSINTPPKVGAYNIPAHATWQAIYEAWYGTPYPHLEPWKLQGYVNKPTWWDDEYLNTGTHGTRMWKYIHTTHTGMWYNILHGVTPAGRPVPDWTVPTYNYVPVNIDDVATDVNGIQPDELLPPFFNQGGSDTAIDVRSIFTNYNADIVAPSSDFSFGSYGPVEWKWRTSTQFVYDQLIVEFLMEPARFLHYTFGPDYVLVDGLHVNMYTHKVYSHKDVLFHGDVRTDGEQSFVRGINQWYVSRNRYAGFDTSGILRNEWANWEPKLAYQTSGICDTSTFSVTSKFFDLTPQDYSIELVKDDSIDQRWVDAFVVNVLSMPPAIMQYNNESQWKFSVDTMSPVARSVEVHGVKRYPVRTTLNSDEITVYQYVTNGANSIGRWISVPQNQLAVFTIGSTITVSESSIGNGTYTVRAVSYDPVSSSTKITVNEAISSSIDGVVTPSDRLPAAFETGDAVLAASTKNLPYPLLANNRYYVIAVDGYTFKLAETYDDALAGNAITLTTLGSGDIYIGKAKSTFQVYGGTGPSKETWIHYEIDENVTRLVDVPMTVHGLQNLIDLVDGLEAKQADFGIVTGSSEYAEYDSITGRQVNWQSEIERFIDWAYRLRRSNIRLADRFEIKVANLATDELSFVSEVPGFAQGTRVTLSTTGATPTNVDTTTEYFYYSTGASTFKLSLYNTPTITDAVDIQSIGSGKLFISQITNQEMYPAFEINPMRNQIVVRTPVGMLGSVLQTPYADVRINQVLFDQYGRPLTSDKAFVYRYDLESRIVVLPNIANDVQPQIVGLEDEYNYIHLGGAHLSIDSYQHIVLFNNVTSDGSFVYQPFIGLNVRRFNLDYYETSNYTLRPTIGGHFLVDNQFHRNMEGTAKDMETYYSAYDQITQTPSAIASKKLLDYSGTVDYLNDIAVTPSAQFTFYRGMIQSKGSAASVSAYINSRRFIDANMDEYWAWKIATFGDARPKYYPEIKLNSKDGTLDDVQLLFTADRNELTSSTTLDLVDKGFEIVEANSETRFYEQPNQTPGLFLDAAATTVIKLYVGPSAPITIKQTALSDMLWVNAQTLAVNKFVNGVWVTDDSNTIKIIDSSIVVDLGIPVDAVKLITNLPTTDVVWQGTYSELTRYYVKDAVTYNGIAYECIADSDPGVLPTDTAYWNVLVTTIDSYQTPASSTVNDVVERINSQVCKLSINVINNMSNSAGIVLKLYGMVASVESVNPARLVDTISKTVTANVPLWDPARGVHQHVAIHNVDLTGDDPARYGQSPLGSVVGEWSVGEVGKIWFDDTKIGYVPYYDDVLYPNIKDRLRKWGKLTDWATVDVYRWIESPVSPEDWDNLASSGVEIAQGQFASGTAKKSPFTKKREVITGVEVIDQQYTTVNVDFSDGTAYTAVTDSTLTGLVDGAVYMFNLTVAETTQVVAITATAGMTFAQLASNINMTVGSIVLATVGSVNGGLVFELTTPGAIDVIIEDGSSDPLFEALATMCSTLNVVPGIAPVVADALLGSGGRIKTPTGSFVVGDTIIITSEVTVDSIATGVEYFITDVEAAVGYDLLTISDDSNATLLDTLTDLTAVKGFTSVPWIKDTFDVQRLVSAMLPTNSTTILLDQTKSWLPGDEVFVYKNGEIVTSDDPITIQEDYTVDLPFTVGFPLSDFIDVVKPLHDVTEEEEDVASSADDGTSMQIWSNRYEFSTASKLSASGTAQTLYYFWVKDEATRNPQVRSSMSAKDIATNLNDLTTPYLVLQIPMDDPTLANLYGYGITEFGSLFSQAELAEQYLDVPVYYRAAILRNCSDYITDDDRYIVRFTRDQSLRYLTNNQRGQVNNKPKHEEWIIFRRKQLGTVSRVLWDRVVEAMIGYTLADATIRVPALNRSLYDDLYGTDTRFGLGEGQAFVDKDLAIQTVVSFITNPEKDFYPIDIDFFLSTNRFDTPEGIRAAMAEIYESFGSAVVNDLWFELLNDALTSKKQHSELMKTSWIALHGIRILDVGGMFDD